jgi:ferric-dicitrate binding protein FerR (iron transport regulator)
MKENSDDQLLQRYSEGKYSYRDFKRIVSLFQDPEKRAGIESTLSRNWDEFKYDEEEANKDLSAVYEKLRLLILSGPTKMVRIQRVILQSYTKVAAILLLPLLIYTAISYFQHDPAWAEIYSPSGARTQFTLPDGTRGWLNSNTKLKYPLDFKEKRHLDLTGEAYFEVTHNKRSPFVVSTHNIDIMVLGTIFSVSAIDGENTTEVVLEKGRVAIENQEIKLKATLEPNEKLIFNNENKKFHTAVVNAQQYNSWKDGLLVFRNEPLSEVFKRLSRWYNVKITIEDQQINRYKYRATFRDEPIEEVIRLIAITVPIEYVIQKRTIEDQGVYAIKEIIIKKK